MNKNNFFRIILQQFLLCFLTFSQADSKSLKFLSYNIYMRPFPFNENGNDFKTARARIFCDYFMNQFDVVALQEAFWGIWQLDLIECARKKGLVHYTRGPGVDAKGFFRKFKIMGSGLLLLSRYPLVNVTTMIYSSGVRSDARATKGAIYAEVMYGADQSEKDPKMSIITTHLQASYENWSESDKTTQARFKQLSELHDWVKGKWDGSSPLLLLGDLNTNGRPEPQNLHSAEMPRDFMVNGSTNAWPNTGKSQPSGNSTQEYIRAMKSLRGEKNDLPFRDLVFEKFKFHPPTYGVGGLESVFTSKKYVSMNHSLDYVMAIQPLKKPGTFVNPEIRSFRYDPKECPGCKHKGVVLQQCSDHYGVSVEFKTA